MSRLRKHLKSKSASSKKVPNDKAPSKGSTLAKSKTILRRKSPPVKVEEENENTPEVSRTILKRKVVKDTDETVSPEEAIQVVEASKEDVVEGTESTSSAEQKTGESVDQTEAKETQVSKEKSLDSKLEKPKTNERPKELAHLGKAVIAGLLRIAFLAMADHWEPAALCHALCSR